MSVVSPHGRTPIPSHSPDNEPLLMMLLHRAGLLAVWGAIGVSVMASMNAFQPLGWILLAFVIIAALLLVASHRTDAARNKAARWLLRIGIVGAALLPPVAVFKPVIPFALASWALTGVYWAALLAGDWRSLKDFLRSVSVLFGLALLTAVTLVTVPGAAAFTGEDKMHWTVKLHVSDPDSLPISNATADCLTVDFWDRNRTALLEAKMPRVTDQYGEAEFEFTGSRWLKAVVCGAQRSAQDAGPALPLVQTAISAPFPYFNTSAYITLKPAELSADAVVEPPPAAAPDAAAEAPQAAPEAPTEQSGTTGSEGQDSTPQQTTDSSAEADRLAFEQAQQRQMQAEAASQAFIQAQQGAFQAQRQADDLARQSNPK